MSVKFQPYAPEYQLYHMILHYKFTTGEALAFFENNLNLCCYGKCLYKEVISNHYFWRKILSVMNSSSPLWKDLQRWEVSEHLCFVEEAALCGLLYITPPTYWGGVCLSNLCPAYPRSCQFIDFFLVQHHQ